jgi:hypothetical protein
MKEDIKVEDTLPLSGLASAGTVTDRAVAVADAGVWATIGSSTPSTRASNRDRSTRNGIPSRWSNSLVIYN